jgi:hypothetical protein
MCVPRAPGIDIEAEHIIDAKMMLRVTPPKKSVRWLDSISDNV